MPATPLKYNLNALGRAFGQTCIHRYEDPASTDVFLIILGIASFHFMIAEHASDCTTGSSSSGATAAAAIFSIGYVIHMRLVDLEAWDAAKHNDQAQLSKARMASGLVLPLATAIGLAVLFSWGGVIGVGNGIKWALVVAVASALPVPWYNWF